MLIGQLQQLLLVMVLFFSSAFIFSDMAWYCLACSGTLWMTVNQHRTESKSESQSCNRETEGDWDQYGEKGSMSSLQAATFFGRMQ